MAYYRWSASRGQCQVFSECLNKRASGVTWSTWTVRAVGWLDSSFARSLVGCWLVGRSIHWLVGSLVRAFGRSFALLAVSVVRSIP